MPSLISKKEQKRRLAARNREIGRPGYKYVSYCPKCPRMVNPSDPEQDCHIVVGERSRTGKCPHGHEWSIE